MLIILIFWGFLLSIIIPCGSIFTTLYNKLCDESKRYSFFDIFWLGLSFLSAVIISLSLFLPINIYVLGCISFFAFLYTIFNRNCHKIYRDFFSKVTKIPIPSLIIVGLTTFFTLIISSAPASSYDMGLYHLQSMIWSEQYNAVPGLANLHGRLAFNSSSLLLSTLFSFHPKYFPVIFPLNGLCMYILTMFLLYKVVMIKDLIKQTVIIVSIFFMLFFFMKELSSSNTDILPSVITVYLIYRFLMNEDKGSELIYLVLPLFCCTLKLSSLPIVVFSLLALFFCIKEKEWRKIIFLLIISGVIIIPWLARYAILSGYLIYPFSKIDILNVDWKVPRAEVIREEQVTYAWARIPHRPYSEVLNMPLADWLPVWFKAKANTIKYLIYLVIFSPFIIGLSFLFNRKHIKYIAVWLIAVSGLSFNFLTAPDPRFSYSFLILTAFLPYYNFSFKSPKEHLKYYGYIISAVIMIYFISVQRNIFENKNILIEPYYLDYWPNNITFETHYIDSIKLYKPIDTDRCFDYCIPCSPYLNEGLELRGKSLQNGFKMNDTIDK